MILEPTTTLAFGALTSFLLPLTGWAVRSHFKLQATERRIDLLETWRGNAEDSNAKTNGFLLDVRLEVTRLSTLQAVMNDSILRIESRIDKTNHE